MWNSETTTHTELNYIFIIREFHQSHSLFERYMTYIELINWFWSLDEDWEFTCCETRLYFYLLKTANRLGWVDSWTRSDTKVSSDVGVSVNSMKSARNRLVQAGLITFKSGGKGQRDKTRYQISYQNLTPKVEPKVEPNLIPNHEPKVEPKPLQYNVRALDKDKDKDNYLSPPRAYEEIPTGIFERRLDECYEELKSNSSWMEAVCMNTRLCGYKDFAPPDFYDYLEKFFMKLQNEGETVKSPQDAKSHFARWLKIELEKQRNNGNNNRHNYTDKQEANAYALSLLQQHKRDLEEGLADQMERPF